MESEHYKLLFPNCEVIGLDYQTFSDLKGTECGVAITPWDTGKEIYDAVKELKRRFENIILIANKHQATLTVMDGGEHWFHTEEQMAFLDNWIKGVEV
jgi:hypothetical protein